MRWLVDLCVRFAGTIATLTLVALALGIWATQSAPLDVFPEFVPSTVDIQTEAPGFTAQQVEQLVTKPIENAVNGSPGLATIRSESIPGLSVITVQFADKIDLYNARQGIAEHLSELGSALPLGVDTPRLSPLTSSTMDLLKIGLVSDKLTPFELRDQADWVMKPALLAVPGVAHVLVFGGAVREIHIEPDLKRMTSYGFTLTELADAARAALALKGVHAIWTAQDIADIGPIDFREARPSTRKKPAQIEIRHRPIGRDIRRSRPREKSTTQNPAHRIQIGSRERLASLCIATLFGQHRFRGPGQPLSRGAQPGIGQGRDLLNQLPHFGPAIAGQLAGQQVNGLDAIGALINRGNAGIAQHLGSAGILNKAHAAMHLHAEGCGFHPAIRGPSLQHRDQERQPRAGRFIAHQLSAVRSDGRFQHDQPRGERGRAHFHQHARHIRVFGNGPPALHTLRGIGFGQPQRRRAMRHALGTNAKPGVVHHGEHGLQAAMRFADHLGLGALIHHDAGGAAMDAHFAFNATAAEGIARAIGQDFRRGKQRNPARARRRIRQARQHQMQDIAGAIMLAPGDENLLPVQGITPIAERLGTRAQHTQITAGLRFG